MPRPASVTSADGFPLWDTFEASFFLIAGLCMGLVLGFLFPSLWRTVRRRFRNTKRFEAFELHLSERPEPLVKLFDDGDNTEAPVVMPNNVPELSVVQAFVLARNLSQEGKKRDAVRVYLDILSFEQVSKRQTNQALFELAQAYASLGLSSRAFDTALELLHRKPESAAAMGQVLKICEQFSNFERTKNIVALFKGSAKPQLRLMMAHLLCAEGELKLQQQNISVALELAREACRQSLISARARVLLWSTSSQQAWQLREHDVRAQMTLLAADLESRWLIFKDTGVSFEAGAGYLADTIEKVFLGLADEPVEKVEGIKSEFLNTSGFTGLDQQQKLQFQWMLVVALKHIESFSTHAREPTVAALLRYLVPDFVDKMLVNQTSTLYDHLIGIGMRVHRCQVCGNKETSLPWSCKRCDALESFQPDLNMETLVTCPPVTEV